MEIIGILRLIIIAPVALGIWPTIAAKHQLETVTTLSPARPRALVDDGLGKLFWAGTDGPGDLNFRRRAPNGSGATISIDFETTANAKTVVQAWRSHWQSRMGMVAGGWGTGKKIIRKTDQATA